MRSMNHGAPPVGVCHCRHSFAAHYLTHDGTCGFCYCRMMATDVRHYRLKEAGRRRPRIRARVPIRARASTALAVRLRALVLW
jgi:hypothetical protein